MGRTALLPDESEAELELVDNVGLSPHNAKHTKRPCQDPTYSQTSTPSPQPSNPPASTLQIQEYGCRWDSDNYSCSYDCVFMTFVWAYFHATGHWRTTWTGQSVVAKTLSRHFKTIVRAIEGLVKNQPTPQISTLFSRGRDAFRDVLSEQNPGTFRRFGPVDACLIDILDSLSHDETSSKYFTIISSCGGLKCKIKLTKPAGAPYILTPNTWTSITNSQNPPHHESLQEWVVGWVDRKVSTLPRSCAGCSRGYSQTHSFLHPPWIWFEIFVEQPRVVLPSFTLSFSSHVYRLAAALYGNGCHFIARLNTPSGSWWHYDGQVNGGRPTAVSITCEEDLLTCGGRYTLNALVYCSTC